MKRILCLALSAALLLLCGCSQADVYTPTGNGLTWDEDYTGPTYDAPQQEGPESLVMTYYPELGLNPYTCTDFTNRALFSLLYQGLFSTSRSYQVEPVLCKQYSVSPDMRTYTFYLESASFSDGSVLTAQDVVASLQAAKAGTYYKGRFFHIADIAAGASGSVVITLDTAMENLPLLLDIPIVKASQVDSEYPAGTGPYTLSSNNASLQLRDNWWCKAQLQINAATIALVRAESVTQIRDQFEFFDLNLVCADPFSDHYVDYRCDHELWDYESGLFMYMTFSASSEVLADPEVRSAFTYAIDRDKLAADYYRGFARSTTLPASPMFPYYSQGLAARYSYDPERFAQIMADKGLVGSTVALLVNKDDSLRLRVAKDIAQMLTDAGLVVHLSALSSDECMEALQYRVFDIYLGQTKLSPNMDLSAFFHTNGALSYGGVNDVAAYSLCLQALENHGNYYTLFQTVMENGLMCPILVGSHAVYTTRGLLAGLSPSRDNIFYYSLGKTMDDANIQPAG